MTRTALYARVSEDREGRGASVDRQREDCRALAAARGWAITQEFVDNNISAYSGKTRPAFEAMLGAITEGHFDAVVVYHQDRLTRTPAEFENFLSVCERAKVKSFATVTGYTDLGHGDGVMVARIYAAVAANQSDAAGRRIRRKNDERAAAGLPHVSGERAYGYELDRLTVRESEAAVIRELAQRFLAGESLNSLTVWLSDRGEKTATGLNDWRTPTLRNLLRSPRIAGLREHRGEIVGRAAWPSIISEEQHRRIRARTDQTAATRQRNPRRYLLSGLVRCALCGAKMVSAPDSGRRRYGCRSGPDFGGCGRIYAAGDSLDRLVADAVLLRLGSVELSAALQGAGHERADLDGLRLGIENDSAQLDELANAYAAKHISMKEWLAARQVIDTRLEAAKKDLARATDTDLVHDLVANSASVAQAWADSEMTLQRQVAIIRQLVDRVTVAPASRKSNRLDPSRITIEWKV